MIPPQGNGDFVAAMERVLDVYRRPYDADYPVVCMDETPRQLIGETRVGIPARCGRAQRYDYEYRRCGVCNVFMATEPLAARRLTKVTERRTKIDWAPNGRSTLDVGNNRIVRHRFQAIEQALAGQIFGTSRLTDVETRARSISMEDSCLRISSSPIQVFPESFR